MNLLNNCCGKSNAKLDKNKQELFSKLEKNTIIFINIFISNRSEIIMEIDEDIEELKNEHEKEEEEQREKLEEEEE